MLRSLERWGVSKSDTKAATSTERARQNRVIPRFVSLGETLLGSFVSDLDTMPWLLGREVSSCCVSGHG